MSSCKATNANETESERLARIFATHPADPSTISFDRRCFAQDGIKVEFSVGAMAPNYPKKFGANEAAANEWARKTGRPVIRHESPRMVRVSWT